jgi:hypothetical protein
MRKKVRAWCTKRKDGWWYAYFYDEEGKYWGQSLETKSKKDAERKFKDFEKELAAKIVAKERADDYQDHMQWLTLYSRTRSSGIHFRFNLRWPRFVNVSNWIGSRSTNCVTPSYRCT